MTRLRRSDVVALFSALGLIACTPKAPALRGDVVPARLPRAELPSVNRKVVFNWSYADRNYRARGEGVARVSAPDSVRLDFFLERGMGGGHAVLIGEDLRAPDANAVRQVLPPPALLWAALGRLAIGAPPDTVARAAGDTLFVDAGRSPRWRSTFVRDSLRALMLIESDRVRQSVIHDGANDVRFRDTRLGRSLHLTILRVDTVPEGFDATIWR